MVFRQIADDTLAQYAYLIGCQKTGEALVVDPERDVDRYLALAAAEGLRLVAVAETHIHADFLSGARELAERHGVRLYLSDEGAAEGWASSWAKGGRYDAVFLHDGDTFRIGHIVVRALHTPGHTPEHLAFAVTDAGGGADAPLGIVSGDFVFVGDLGRPDLLESAAGVEQAMRPSAERLHRSVQGFLELDDFLQVWPGHGAGSACGKALGAVPQTTVGYERRFNDMIGAARRGRAAFVEAILDGQPEPPLYFARMKRLNRDGVPLLGALPTPRALAPADLGALPENTLVLDTRADRSAFMAAHLPGALYAPLGKSFSTAVGSLVEDPDVPLVLILPEARVEEAVRDLVRIGYDRVVAYATYETLTAYLDAGGRFASIPEMDFAGLAALRKEDAAVVVDVRRRAEYEAGHVPGSVLAPHTRLPALTDRIPEGRPLLVHCQSGVRAALASAYLAREGYDVTYVNDGFPHYREAGEVETGAPAETYA